MGHVEIPVCRSKRKSGGLGKIKTGGEYAYKERIGCLITLEVRALLNRIHRKLLKQNKAVDKSSFYWIIGSLVFLNKQTIEPTKMTIKNKLHRQYMRLLKGC